MKSPGGAGAGGGSGGHSVGRDGGSSAIVLAMISSESEGGTAVRCAALAAVCAADSLSPVASSDDVPRRGRFGKGGGGVGRLGGG